ncbi:hypothetical protein [Acidimangrovimonas sediminis]|uniref:hypothetical protein n=1 Tax=Acidimangrovimonas sediminis TaxID=2056283 RepID=UPI000C80EE11|nr:hypothetical protein [Acidimangrovimonas sediminis]
MKAWIIKWAWIGDHAAVDKPIICVLSAHRSPKKVREFVELYYASQSYSIAEQMGQADYNNPSPNPYPAEFQSVEGVRHEGFITCGHNPWIEAFVADGVCIDEASGKILWEGVQL